MLYYSIKCAGRTAHFAQWSPFMILKCLEFVCAGPPYISEWSNVGGLQGLVVLRGSGTWCTRAIFGRRAWRNEDSVRPGTGWEGNTVMNVQGREPEYGLDWRELAVVSTVMNYINCIHVTCLALRYQRKFLFLASTFPKINVVQWNYSSFL
jgi:hypothetical protein